VGAAVCVEVKPVREPLIHIGAIRVALEIHVFILHASPKPLDEHIIIGPAAGHRFKRQTACRPKGALNARTALLSPNALRRGYGATKGLWAETHRGATP
jgi:hypothetical protein